MHNSEQERIKLQKEQLEAKEKELRLREIEIEIHQDEAATSEPPLYQTNKHQPPENSIQKLGRKTLRIAKFIGFVVVGIAVIRAGLFIGIWITYLVMAGILAGIGYQIFLKDDN